MKNRTLVGFALVAAAFATCLIPQPTLGQTAEDLLLAQTVDEVTKQQATIVENQAKIEEKLALIAEDVRMGRIYVSRGGGKVKPEAK